MDRAFSRAAWAGRVTTEASALAKLPPVVAKCHVVTGLPRAQLGFSSLQGEGCGEPRTRSPEA